MAEQLLFGLRKPVTAMQAKDALALDCPMPGMSSSRLHLLRRRMAQRLSRRPQAGISLPHHRPPQLP
jgi:hypothetical protein